MEAEIIQKMQIISKCESNLRSYRTRRGLEAARKRRLAVIESLFEDLLEGKSDEVLLELCGEYFDTFTEKQLLAFYDFAYTYLRGNHEN